MPIENPKIVPDVMNPHYGEWYTNGKAPVDSDKPVPIFFLTVKDTAFQFLLGSKYYNLNEDVFWDGKTLGWWLINALSEHGIGAKTAVGYGYMNQM
jgi:CRISPR-associated protein Cmr6